MNTVLLISIIGVPLLLIVAGQFFNWKAAVEIRSEIKDVRTDMKSGFDKVDAHFVTVEGDLRHFYSITGELKGRLDTIEKK